MNVKRELGIGLFSVLILAFYIFSIVKQNTAVPKILSLHAVKQIPSIEVANHNTPTDCWIVIQHKAYDVTKFLSNHPGGEGAIIPYCGADATEAFATKNKGKPHSEEAKNLLQSFYIGDL